jgi:putative peptidoglycan lipid II flippase
MAAATVASRFLGLVREIVAAALFGATNEKAAYVIGYYLPFFIQRLLLGGTLSIVFIPTISRYLSRGDTEDVKQVTRNLFTVVVLAGAGMVVVGELVAPLFVPLAAPGFGSTPGLLSLAILLTRIIFVAMFFLALSVFATGYLQAHHHFTVPALAPLLFNGVIIAGTLILGPRVGIAGLALSWVLGTAAQFVIQLPTARRFGLQLRPSLNLRHPAVREIGRLAIPAMLGLAVIEINAYVDRFFASFLPTAPGVNAVAVLDYAYEVIQAPTGIFAISIATAVFPSLARHAAAGAREDLRAMASVGLRTTVFTILPVAAFLLALRGPVIRVLFERGQFTTAATGAVAGVLAAFAVGLPAFAAYYVVTRTYYALQDMATPVRIGLGMILLNAALDYLLMRLLGVAGLALSTSIVGYMNVGALLWFLRGKLGRIDGGRLAQTILRTGVAATIAAGAMVFLGAGIPSVVAVGGLTGQLLQVGLAATGGFGVYLLGCWIFRVEELGLAFSLFGRPPSAASAR